ncbi:hypothetical protein N8143_00560 [Pelagibacteraceae bacterium]|nr:hypothetical protein [Pelagibacteraceae bacterium]
MNFNISSFVGGLPSSGSSLLFYKLSKIYETAYFESGYFCNPKLYRKFTDEVAPFNVKSKSDKKINLDKIFLEKTPENIFFFKDIINKFDCNFIITKRNTRDVLYSLLKRDMCSELASFVVGATNVEISSVIQSDRVKVMDYLEICDLNIEKEFSEFISKDNINMNQSSFSNISMNSWKYKITDRITKSSLQYSNPEVDNCMNRFFIKKDNLFYKIDGTKVNNMINFSKKNLDDQLSKFLESKNYCLIEKKYT